MNYYVIFNFPYMRYSREILGLKKDGMKLFA